MWMHSSPTQFADGAVLLPRSVTGAPSAGYPYDADRARSLGQYDDCLVYVIDCADVGLLPGNLADPSRWIYEVMPIEPLGEDPERTWPGLGSATCQRAIILRTLRPAARSVE